MTDHNLIQNCIGIDQKRFMKDIWMSDNIKRILDNFQYVIYNTIPAIGLFLDAEKVFGLTEWYFLDHVLQKIGFGLKLMYSVATIYKSPQATLTINGMLAKRFDPERDTIVSFVICSNHRASCYEN